MYKAEYYCKVKLALKHRSALSKCRCGVAPIRIETGRYTNLVETECLRQLCNLNAVESKVYCFNALQSILYCYTTTLV